MQRFLIGNVFLLVSMISAVSSQIVLKALIDEMQPLVSGWREIPAALNGPRLARLLLSMVLLVVGYASWVSSLLRLDLSYAYPIACTSVLFAVFFSVWFLGETVQARHWIGTVLIVVGVILLMPNRG